MLEKLTKVSKIRNQKINKVEKLKSNKSPKEAFEKIKEYAKMGYDSIESEDKALFFKYFGIFDKEKPNGANHFMLRVRIVGGKMTPMQAKTVGEIAKQYGNNYIDITTRMQIELRYLKIEDLPTVLQKLDDVGITTFQTGIDNLRNIVTDPLDGLSYDNVFEVMPLIEKLQEIFLKKDEWIGTLPRKFNTSITGSYANRCNVFGHDCCFALAQKDGVFGFNVYLGGRVGVLASSANVFLYQDQVVLFFKTLIDIFKEYGFRDNRNKNRLHFFIQEVGMQNLVQFIRERSGVDFLSAGENLVQLEHFDAKYGKVALKNNSFALHVVIPAGIFDGDSLIEASEIAKNYGEDIRLSVDQNLYITGIKNEDIQSVLKHGLFDKYKNIDSAFFNNMISCPGSETCSFGVIKGKSDAIELSNYLSQTIDMSDAKVRIYWSACIKGCGIHEFGDIGLLGCKTKLNGESVPGVDILLGGNLVDESTKAKMILKSIPLCNAKYYIEELILEYKRLKLVNESFEQFFIRVLKNYSKGAIAFLMSFNYMITRVFNLPELKVTLDLKPETLKYELFEIFHFGEMIYKKIEGRNPYSMVRNFQTKERSVKIKKKVDPKIASIVNKMIDTSAKRAEVFSELLVEINQ